ncbi:flagellar hook-basal body complex protein FliE [Acidocella aromatica]|uniref:Flagellar hook-basal body complex protein FliE n=1 Tax=Acidocella aromatica TaxID=1303579 RepID=A0A840VU59_9PROT|nr:flagellar hook-basal body complex protein FliE [Acidocella aromatica]MBB5373742.1 flagellar hook-basal body complex protein FliE [Acidocella aromatica]
MLTNMAVQAAGVAAGAVVGAGNASATTAPKSNFLDLVNTALQGVSATQSSATAAEAGYAAGAPGATLGKALVASDRAEVAWNATVAVRNEVVSAYQSIMNMQF